MTTLEALTVGTRAKDRVTESEIVFIDQSSKTAEEYEFTYDHNKQPVTVAEDDSNREFPDDDAVVLVVYCDSLSSMIPEWESLDTEELVSRVRNIGLKEYALPLSRVKTGSL
jgi:hypothetical protein